MSEISGQLPISLKLEYTPFVNFAMQQNSVPLLKSLTAINNSETQIKNMKLRIWCDPPVVADKNLQVDSIDQGASYTISDLPFTLMREILRKQTEREEGHIWIEATAEGFESQKQLFPISVLAYNEWYGVSSIPETVAAHVLPNDSAVEKVLVEASKLLKEKTQDGSLSGYQTGDPRRVWIQAAAIYYAAARQKITYVNPPASFEQTGQKIRTPEHILNRKLGTCMDTTTFLAACYEQAGLRPILVFIEGHAFPGVWLQESSFDEPVATHASILLNRIELKELLVLESTCITKSPTTNFGDAAVVPL